ncbi:MAG: hypothetical protein DMG11_02325 [Acidobacteria bacterium]|nr:MAG: hypothetical protein DMG11_02325 [Acidobacteriota bacterium]
MSVRAGLIVTALLVSSCTGVRSVQLTPPTPVPPGLICGYGVERIRDNPDRSHQSAFLKAMDDLLTRGPVVVSKTVQDRTTVLDLKSASRTMESSFRLRASRMLQPSFMDTGVEDGFVWVLVGTTEEDIERGWQQFVQWRAQKLKQAQKLFQDAKGPERLALLKAALEVLEEAGAADDPGMLYYQVKAAIETENTRIAELETLQKQFRSLTESGQLVAAEMALDNAQRLGLEQMACEQFRMEIEDHRKQAAQLIAAGDDLFRDEQYKEALDRYRRAQQLDRDNPQLPTKLAMADRYHRTARSQAVRSTVGLISVSATRAIGDYFAYKREQEERKHAEAEKAAAEAKQKQEKEREREAARRPAAPPPAQPQGTVEQNPERRGLPDGMSPP